jgi:hypothetical protein
MASEPDRMLWPTHQGPLTQLADGTPFPASVEFLIADPLSPTEPLVRVGLEVTDGRVEVVRFALEAAEGGRGISATDWRRATLDRYVRLVTEQVGRVTAVKSRAFTQTAEQAGGLTVDDLNAAAAAGGAAGTNAWVVHRAVTDELLAEVAEIAKANPRRRTLAVQATLGTSHRNASRWIAAAEARGFLPKEAGR